MALEVLIYPSQEVLSKLWTEHPTAIVVVPDPPRADLWRARWGHTGAAVKTINEWQTAELERCFGRERRASSKAHIMLYLGRALREGWRRQWVPRDAVEGLDFHWFNQAYTLLSDLRSFTLDFSLLHDFWPLHPQLGETVQFLQQCLELGDLWDEHQVYAQLSAKYHDPQVPPPLAKTVIFWGFAHLSAMQVDYLKALGERVQVIVPYPAKAWQNSLPSDWIRWLSPLGPEEIKTTFTLPAQGQYQLASFPGGRLAATIAQLNFPRETNLFLLTKDLKWPSQEIAQANTAAKIKIDLWQSIIEQLWQSLQECRHQQGKFNEEINDNELSLEQWAEFLKQWGNKIQQQASLGDLTAGRWFKVWSLLKQLGEEWQALSSKRFTIAGFELALWRKVLYQRVPRVYGLTTPAQTAQAITVFDLNALPFYDPQKYNVVVASSSFERWRPLGEKYREEELRILTALGPIFREDVAYQAQLQSLAELLQGPTLLLAEENLLQQELGLHEIIAQMAAAATLDPLKTASSFSSPAASFWQATIEALPPRPLPPLSARSLQTFVDCPRKFALQYLGGYQLDPRPQQTLQNRELGTLAHAIIAAWGQSTAEVSLAKLIEQQLMKISFVTPYDRWKAFEDLYYHTAPILKELQKLEAQAPRATWKFEYDLAYRFDPTTGAEEKTNVQGKIDLIIPHPLGLMLFDFKRANSPSEEDIRKFKNIQLWFYTSHGINPAQLVAWGFLNLDHLDKSTVMAVTPEAQAYLGKLNFMGTTIRDASTLFSEDLPRYQQQEAQWVAQMQRGEFTRNPQGPGCDWCPWFYVCGD